MYIKENLAEPDLKSENIYKLLDIHKGIAMKRCSILEKESSWLTIEDHAMLNYLREFEIKVKQEIIKRTGEQMKYEN